MNCVLYSSLIMKYNQVSQNVDTTAQCPQPQEKEIS